MDDLPTRWEVELEFVQSLANIQYVNYLAQSEYFNDPTFIAYLEYLMYWKDEKYSRYLVYPNCLHILTLLQSEEFRKSVVNPEFMNALMNDMVKRWQQPEETGQEKNGTEDNLGLTADAQVPEISIPENGQNGGSVDKA
ncbi:hypothetical protein PUMCH_002492 [Australozyma saopauloensis]|uniref:Mediator of RNA polymerase II transcription subunit 31 n=1 Tax=Australozyma saopauloensis TaxID=291208 RepID=A0AAX4H9K5_9ASCO|nr:hypothetical protein PUMCH_002492 [[Candida] saopauloensis]